MENEQKLIKLRNKKTEFVAALFSGYLTEDMAESYGANYIQEQKDLFGYEDYNFNGQNQILTPKHRVVLLSKDDSRYSGPQDVRFAKYRGPQDVDFAIHGSTRLAEEMVRDYMGSGLIFARYSIFYGGPSVYSENSPEESGYALDLPKSIDVVNTLLNNDRFLKSVLTRKEDQIKSALDEVNKGIEKPILVTSYLSEVLSYEKTMRNK